MTSNTNLTGNWYESEIGKEILSKKYFHEGEDFDAFANRVSSIFSPAIKDKVKDALYTADFFPAGRSLYGAGSKGKFKASMSNCYISEMPEDNIESIFDTAKKAARIFSYGGGIGINISKLRPRGAKVSNAAKTSTGSISFMNIFNTAGEVIGANNRRAALLLGLNCDHPDIEEFLEIKKNNTAIQAANISILFTDEFMKAVDENDTFTLRFKVDATGEEITKGIFAKAFFMKFCEANHSWAEPGTLFIDKIRSHNLLSGYPDYHIDISNPCAEYLGNAGNSCNLGSINLYNIVKNPFTPTAYIDYIKLSELVTLGVKALDEILDYGLEMQPLDINKKNVTDWRAIGLGVFGLADMLIAMNMRYGSEGSISVVEEIMKTIFTQALTTSALLAKEKGTFAKYDWLNTSQSPLLDTVSDDTLALISKYGLRNGSLLSIAPTGSIATMAGLSGGAEPLFAVSYERTTHSLEKTGKKFKVYAKSVEHGNAIMGKGNTEIIIPDFAVAAHEVAPIDRVRLQATMQKYVDNAISSTVNLKHDATVNEVYDCYVHAWKAGCKGLTIFRDGCERTPILITEKPKEKEPVEVSEIVLDSITPLKRSHIRKLPGNTYVGHTSCVKNLYTTINRKDGKVFELFTNTSSGCKSNINTINRLASLAIRSGAMVTEVIGELRANVCPACSVLIQKGEKVSTSCGACVAEALEEEYFSGPEFCVAYEVTDLLECPSCHEKTLRPEGRCFTCSACGFSKCE